MLSFHDAAGALFASLHFFMLRRFDYAACLLVTLIAADAARLCRFSMPRHGDMNSGRASCVRCR